MKLNELLNTSIVYELIDFKIGILILFFTIVVSIFLFGTLNFKDFNMPNFITVLAGLFGISIAFYFLYKL